MVAVVKFISLNDGVNASEPGYTFPLVSETPKQYMVKGNEVFGECCVQKERCDKVDLVDGDDCLGRVVVVRETEEDAKKAADKVIADYFDMLAKRYKGGIEKCAQ